MSAAQKLFDQTRIIFLATCIQVFTVSAWAECNSALVTNTPASQYQFSDKGTVIDTTTGLEWRRCAQGYDWSAEGVCRPNNQQPSMLTWQQALMQAQQSQFADYDDWRVPNKNELDSIVDRSCWDPAINTDVFPQTPAELFWSATPNGIRSDVTWVVSFGKGEHRNLPKTELAALRLVRNAQP